MRCKQKRHLTHRFAVLPLLKERVMLGRVRLVGGAVLFYTLRGEENGEASPRGRFFHCHSERSRGIPFPLASPKGEAVCISRLMRGKQKSHLTHRRAVPPLLKERAMLGSEAEESLSLWLPLGGAVCILLFTLASPQGGSCLC